MDEKKDLVVEVGSESSSDSTDYTIRDELPEYSMVLTEIEYDDAIIGISHDDRVIYSYEKLAEIMSKRDNCDIMDAYEFIDYNVIRGIPYAGEYAPIIMFDVER